MWKAEQNLKLLHYTGVENCDSLLGKMQKFLQTLGRKANDKTTVEDQKKLTQLIKGDAFNRMRAESSIFETFTELLITFWPTYKRDPVSGHFKLIKTKNGTRGVRRSDSVQGRVPGFADRIIANHNENLSAYGMLKITGSDHCPVTLLYKNPIAVEFISYNTACTEIAITNILAYVEKREHICILCVQEINLAMHKKIAKVLYGVMSTSMIRHNFRLGIYCNRQNVINSSSKQSNGFKSNPILFTKGYMHVKCELQNGTGFTVFNVHCPFKNEKASFGAWTELDRVVMEQTGDKIFICGDFNSRSQLETSNPVVKDSTYCP